MRLVQVVEELEAAEVVAVLVQLAQRAHSRGQATEASGFHILVHITQAEAAVHMATVSHQGTAAQVVVEMAVDKTALLGA